MDINRSSKAGLDALPHSCGIVSHFSLVNLVKDRKSQHINHLSSSLIDFLILFAPENLQARFPE
jgi:hypothetical protein